MASITNKPMFGATGNGLRARLIKALVLASVSSAFLLAMLVFVTTSLPAMLGFKSMIVTSGSMEPNIRTGDVVLIVPGSAGPIDAGDVITFQSTNGSGMVTHRVISDREINGRQYFRTQGDANPSPDPNLVPIEAVYGSVAMQFPKLGYLLRFISSTEGRFLLIALPLLFIVAFEFRSLLSDVRGHQQATNSNPWRAGTSHEQAHA